MLAQFADELGSCLYSPQDPKLVGAAAHNLVGRSRILIVSVLALNLCVLVAMIFAFSPRLWAQSCATWSSTRSLMPRLR